MSRSLHKFAKLAAGATWILIVAGGLVTSTGSGLAVPDWPTSFGGFFPPLKDGVLFEHGHRMVAAGVGLLTFSLALWMLLKERRRWVRGLAVCAFLAVITQAVLGGITVLRKLPTPISVSHACLAQLFFCLMLTLALVTGEGWLKAPRFPGREGWVTVHLLAKCIFLLGFVQLVLGAVMRHTGTGLSIPDFPLSYGMWIPPLHTFSVRVHFAHRVGALLIGVLSLYTLYKALRFYRDESRISRLALFLALAVGMQITLGAFTIWTMKWVPVVTAHVAVGALVLGSSLALALTTGRIFAASRVRGEGVWQSYFELTKPRLTGLILVTTAVGFLLAGGSGNGALFFWTLVGTCLVAAGSQTLNQYLEREIDAEMSRTAGRPLPSGRLKAYAALRFGVLLSGAGLVVLSSFANPLAGAFAFFTLASYLFVYTPLKTRTPLCTLVGAVPGALPPVIGWAAASGQVGPGALALFAILFIWQIPHFLAISWMYRDEYARAGFRMLSVLDPDGKMTGRQVLVWTLALLPISLLPAIVGLSGLAYFVGAIILGSAFLWAGWGLSRWLTAQTARRVFLTSIVYLPVLLVLMVLDRGPLR